MRLILLGSLLWAALAQAAQITYTGVVPFTWGTNGLCGANTVTNGTLMFTVDQPDGQNGVVHYGYGAIVRDFWTPTKELGRGAMPLGSGLQTPNKPLPFEWGYTMTVTCDPDMDGPQHIDCSGRADEHGVVTLDWCKPSRPSSPPLPQTPPTPPPAEVAGVKCQGSSGGWRSCESVSAATAPCPACPCCPQIIGWTSQGDYCYDATQGSHVRIEGPCCDAMRPTKMAQPTPTTPPSSESPR